MRLISFFISILLISFFSAELYSGTLDATEYLAFCKNKVSESPNYRTVKIKNNLINIIKSESSVSLQNFPLSEDNSVNVNLKITGNIFDARTKFFKGNLPSEVPDFLTYLGQIDGYQNSKAIVTISCDMIFGMFSIGDEIYYLSPSRDNSDTYIITDGRYAAFPRTINGNDTPDSFDELIKIKNKLDKFDKILTNDLLELELALETDTEFYKATGSDYKKASAYILSLLTQMNMIYQEFINVRIKLTWVKIWTDNPTDPYDAKGDYSILRDRAIPYWTANYDNVERDLYHVCTSINYGGGGFGYFDALCGKKQYGMAVSSLQGWNSLPTFDFSYDLYILSHEIGHNFNAQHTHSCFWNNAPLDTCVVDNGCLPPEQKPLPNPGSIMSYCGGINNEKGFGYRVRMIFLPGNVDQMRKTAELAQCLSIVTEPTLTLLAPHGSEQFINSSSIDINWRAYNCEKIDLKYSIDAGTTWLDIAKQIDAKMGKYSWVLPKICSNKMLVKITSSYNPDLSSASLMNFTVTMDDPDGLVAHYPLNGNSNDEQLCHFYNASNVNYAKLASDRFGNTNSAYSFDGTNYLRADNFDMTFDSLTVTFWFMLNNLDGKQNLIGTNYQEGWIFETYFWGQLGLSLYVDGKGAPDQIWAGGLSPMTWYFGAFTFDSKKALFYLDGIKKGEKIFDNPAKLNRFRTPVYIGSRKDNDFLNGKMDDIRIYKRALSESEIIGLTDIKEELKQCEDMIFITPNPASEYIEINSPSIKRGSGGVSDHFKIYNTFGECISSTPSGGGQSRIDISQLPNGMYLIRIGAYSDRFMVLR